MKDLLNTLKQFRCKFQPKCTPYLQYMKINANDQLDLQGTCLVGCSGSDLKFTYNLYQLDTITNQWLLFTNSSYYYTENNGLSLTMLENLFSDYSSQTIWKVELVALIPSRNASGSSSVMFYVNFPPRSGSCDVNPKNGSTNTLFSISCSNWVDPDGVVVSYAYYGN